MEEEEGEEVDEKKRRKEETKENKEEEEWKGENGKRNKGKGEKERRTVETPLKDTEYSASEVLKNKTRSHPRKFCQTLIWESIPRTAKSAS